jgi:hypothetical protein
MSRLHPAESFGSLAIVTSVLAIALPAVAVPPGGALE